MPNDVRGPGGIKPVDTSQYQNEGVKKAGESANESIKQQTEMMDLQMKVNAQNTMLTAISTLRKGNDDVLRAIANNLK